MIHLFKKILFFTFLFYINVGYTHDISYYSLSTIKHPTQEPAQAIGSYANGCLAGGIKLPKNGTGYQVMRLSRERYYVHPDLYRFITDFSQEINTSHHFKGILVGDTGTAIGGAMPSGHASHQIGLDVDIWLKPSYNRIFSDRQRETLSSISHVTPKQTMRTSWTQDYTDFVLRAANYKQVARIFVNPAIKKRICEHTTDWHKNRKVLAKIRPWYGHDAHMHIRLKCPKNDTYCINQPEPNQHHGCSGSDIDWWFTDEAINPKVTQPIHQKTFKDFPLRCQKLYKKALHHQNKS
jgi:penicillin-insensitive murein DD-endopeptidase